MVPDEFPPFDFRVEDEPAKDVEDGQNAQNLIQNNDKSENLLGEQIDGKMTLHREGLQEGRKRLPKTTKTLDLGPRTFDPGQGPSIRGPTTKFCCYDIKMKSTLFQGSDQRNAIKRSIFKLTRNVVFSSGN